MYSLLYILPKNYLSAVVGYISRKRLPRFFHSILLQWYIKRYHVNLNEMEFSIESYLTLESFFTRRLKLTSRPIGGGIVSPVDGKLVMHGPIDGTRLIQAKGMYYSVEELIQHAGFSASFENGYFLTIYLAPGDYHRIHSPMDGEITAGIWIPGALWPVNDWSVQRIQNLFPKNERVITIIQTPKGKVAVVKVGATNVGQISVSYETERTNKCWPPKPRRTVVREYQNIPIKAGEELGVFHLGSTVVLLFEKGAFSPAETLSPGKLLLGQAISN